MIAVHNKKKKIFGTNPCNIKIFWNVSYCFEDNPTIFSQIWDIDERLEKKLCIMQMIALHDLPKYMFRP